MSLSRAFDLAQWVNEPANVNDGIVVSALGPPFQSQFKPLLTGDAPNDGGTYGRQNATWVAITGSGGSGGIADAPYDSTSYVRQSGAWINILDCGTF